MPDRRYCWKLAQKLSIEDEGFDLDRFSEEYRDDAAMDAFRQDLQQAQYYRIARLPTMIIRHGADKGSVIAGFRPFGELSQLVDDMIS